VAVRQIDGDRIGKGRHAAQRGDNFGQAEIGIIEEKEIVHNNQDAQTAPEIIRPQFSQAPFDMAFAQIG
jgi:hypothetical protein